MSQNHQNGLQKPSQNRVPKKQQNIIIFSTPECGQSIVNTTKIDHFHVFVLTPFLVSFWRSFWQKGLAAQKNINVCCDFLVMFVLFFLCRCLPVAGGAGARAHREKQLFAWKSLRVSHVGRFRTEVTEEYAKIVCVKPQ